VAERDERSWLSRRKRRPGRDDDNQAPTLLGGPGEFDRPHDPGEFDRPHDPGEFDRPHDPGAGPDHSEAERLWTPKVAPRTSPQPRLLLDPPAGTLARLRAESEAGPAPESPATWNPPQQGGAAAAGYAIPQSPGPGLTVPQAPLTPAGSASSGGGTPSSTATPAASPAPAPGSRRARRLAEAAAAQNTSAGGQPGTNAPAPPHGQPWTGGHPTTGQWPTTGGHPTTGGSPYQVAAQSSSPYTFPGHPQPSNPYGAPGPAGQCHPAPPGHEQPQHPSGPSESSGPSGPSGPSGRTPASYAMPIPPPGTTHPGEPGHPGEPRTPAGPPGSRRRIRSAPPSAALPTAAPRTAAPFTADRYAADRYAADRFTADPAAAAHGLLDGSSCTGRDRRADPDSSGQEELGTQGRADRGFTWQEPGSHGPSDHEHDEDEDEDAVRAPRPAINRGPLLPAISVLLVAWSLTCLIDLDRPRTLVGLLAAVAALSPLAAAVAVLVTALAWRGRRWVTAGVAIVAGLVPWLFSLPYAVPASTPSGHTTPVRVLVVNAHEGQADPKDIAAAVRTQSVDLLVVTELTSRMAHDLTVSGMDGRLIARWVSVPPIMATGTGAQAGLGVWSRFMMSDFTPVKGTNWPAVRAKLETGHGKLTVVAGHVVPPTLFSSGSWSTDLAALHRAGEVSGPVTVLGGLNGTPWNPQFRAAAGGGLRDAGDVLGRGIRPTWPSWLGIPLLPLDHALVGGQVGVQSLVGATIDGTDHRALLVTLLVPDDRT
jgi:endonuclease/exonuclease/phosphatase (EEP) superfamily protein YafD